MDTIELNELGNFALWNCYKKGNRFVFASRIRDMNAKNIFEFIKYAYDSVNDSNVILQLNESIYSALQD